MQDDLQDGSVYLPPCYADADKPEDVYKFEDRILFAVENLPRFTNRDVCIGMAQPGSEGVRVPVTFTKTTCKPLQLLQCCSWEVSWASSLAEGSASAPAPHPVPQQDAKCPLLRPWGPSPSALKVGLESANAQSLEQTNFVKGRIVA